MEKASNVTLLYAPVPPLPESFLQFQRVISWIMVIVGIPGAIGNVLTIMVFRKLGLKDAINMSYLALAVSDLCSVITVIFYGITNTSILNLLLKGSHINTRSTLIKGMFGAWPHYAFSRATALLTAWISFQRCLCVLFPIRGKLIATSGVTKVSIVIAFLVTCCPIITVYIGLRPVWVFHNQANHTLLSFAYDLNTATKTIGAVLYGGFFPMFSWMTVIVCTTLLNIKLKMTLKWRHLKGISRNQKNSDAYQVSAKENRITKTVSTIAGIFIVSSLPLSIHGLLLITVPGFTKGGSLELLYQVIPYVSILLSQLNSSVNIIAFASQGHRFRAVLTNTLLGLFRCKFGTSVPRSA